MVLGLPLVLLDLVEDLAGRLPEVVPGQLGREVVGLVLPDLDVDEDRASVAKDHKVGTGPTSDLLQLGLLGRHLLTLDEL